MSEGHERNRLWAEFRAAVKIRQMKAHAFGEIERQRWKMKTRQAGYDWERARRKAVQEYVWAKEKEEDLARQLGLNRGKDKKGRP